MCVCERETYKETRGTTLVRLCVCVAVDNTHTHAWWAGCGNRPAAYHQLPDPGHTGELGPQIRRRGSTGGRESWGERERGRARERESQGEWASGEREKELGRERGRVRES